MTLPRGGPEGYHSPCTLGEKILIVEFILAVIVVIATVVTLAVYA